MIVRIAGIIKESVVDGPGLRLVVFAQGCPHHCKGCQNPDTWDPSEGKDITIEEILIQVKDNPLLKGITLSGGEPFMQSLSLAHLARAVREQGMDVVTYTGYTWEELLQMAKVMPEVRQLIEESDYIIDGPYLEEQKDLSIPFRGSRNQRIIDVRASFKAKKAILADW